MTRLPGMPARILAVCLAVVVVGAAGFVAGSPASAAAVLRADDEPEPLPVDPGEVAVDEGALTLSGVDPAVFNPIDATLVIDFPGGEFDNLYNTTFIVNGTVYFYPDFAMTPHTATLRNGLYQGINEIEFAGYDTEGHRLRHRSTVWAGDKDLTVDLRFYDGEPDMTSGRQYFGAATVSIGVSGTPGISVDQRVPDGLSVLHNVPRRLAIVSVTTDANFIGQAAVGGTRTVATVVVRPIGPVSDVDNNDFGQGGAGWRTYDSSATTVVDHEEELPQPPPSLAAKSKGPRDRSAVAATTDAGKQAAGLALDRDLSVRTAGLVPQLVTRTFQTRPGTTGVRLRYRFVTEEVPGGYYGSEFNDYYRVALRSERVQRTSSETNSMNSLGLGAFDFASGATGWRDLVLPVDRGGDTVQVDVAVSNVADVYLQSTVVVDFVEEIADQLRPFITWNSSTGGIDLTYTVEEGDLAQEGTINVYFARGANASDRLGAALLTTTVPEGTPEGRYGPIHLAGDALAGDPAGTTHLIAVGSPERVSVLADVRVVFGPNANPTVVWPRTFDVIKDALRAAGQPTATVTSTVRTPDDQANIMLANLTNPARSIAANIAEQRNLYGAAGNAVITVFENATRGLSRQEILDGRNGYWLDMRNEINRQGPEQVSRHVGDPARRNVVDIAASSFNAANAALFVAAVRPRVNTFLDERRNNRCFHLELV